MMSCLHYLKKISQGYPEWNWRGPILFLQKTVLVFEVDVVTILSAQIPATQNMITTHFNNMQLA